MVIYIYGSESFKKDIHAVLNHSNIKFRLDEHGEIKDLKSLDDLKSAIEDNPNNIYLIDNEKIIKKNSINQKLKFLKPKDGIEQEFLLDNGIGDISVDSIDELSKHIIKKLETLINEKESNEIQESIVEIVENAYEKDEDKNYVQLDDELSELLSQVDEEVEEDNNVFEDEFELMDSIALIEDEKKEDIDSFSSLKDLSFDQDLANIEIKETTEEKTVEAKQEIDTIEINQGDNYMADEFSQFDTLNEDEILAALDGIENMNASNPVKNATPASPSLEQSNESLDLNGSNVDDIAKLISQLLNNKTLEITVKVKN